MHRGGNARRWRAPERDAAAIGRRAVVQEVLSDLVWDVSLRAPAAPARPPPSLPPVRPDRGTRRRRPLLPLGLTPTGPALEHERFLRRQLDSEARNAEEARKARARLAEGAPDLAPVVSPLGRALARAPAFYSEAFGATRHAVARFEATLAGRQGAEALAKKERARALRDLAVRPTFPTPAPTAPPTATKFLRMIVDREALRLNKARGLPWPWSADDVLNRYKFTNVKREDDRATRWRAAARATVVDRPGRPPLRARALRPSRGAETRRHPPWRRLRSTWTAAHADAAPATVLFNCALFRAFGTVALAEAVGWTREPRAFSADAAVAAAEQVWRGGRHAYTRAYCRPRFNSEKRLEARPRPPTDVYERTAHKLATLAAAVDAVVAPPAGGGRLAWRALAARLREVSGFGGSGFMAKEVLHDAMGWPSLRALVADDKSWTPPGPGARRGLNRLHGRPRDLGALAPANSPTEDRFVAEMVLLTKALYDLDPAFCNRVALDVHDVQFQLCEFDKYERCSDSGRTGTVLPYTPVRGTLTFATADGLPPPGLSLREPDQEWHLSRARATAAKAAPLDDLDDDDGA